MTAYRSHSYWCPLGQPVDRRRLDVFCDHGAFPVWGRFTLPGRDGRPARELHGMLAAGFLGLSAELTTELRVWARWWERHSTWGGSQQASAEERAAWLERGRELAARLTIETGADVVYREATPTGAPDCPHCGVAGSEG